MLCQPFAAGTKLYFRCSENYHKTGLYEKTNVHPFGSYNCACCLQQSN